ncbi:NTP transferase domain-containing protein [Candidatus Micrarchaeota archaeon]|nr:NTP transferase domain-containing protein [Candidatus Micrarchaeota archaeon]
MKALIMAAGEGKRLAPFTENTPKVMLRAAGLPILHHILLELRKAGIKEAVIVVRHLKDQIIEYFSDRQKELGVKISFIEQKEESGTGSAILAAESEFANLEEHFITLAGDGIIDAGMVKQLIRESEGEISIAIKEVQDPSQYGIAIVKDGRVVEFEEKPKQPRGKLTNISLYCFRSSVFEKIRKLKKSVRGEYEIVDLFIGAKAIEVEGYWKDIGFPWDLLEVNSRLLENMKAKREKIENSTIKGKVIMEKGARIINSYIEGNVYIGENSVIGPNAYIRGDTSIGKDCHIGPGSSVKNSILFDHVNAKHLTYIGDSIIASNVNFGAGSQIANYRFDSKEINVHTERGLIGSKRNKLGAFVGEGTKFGVLSCVMPGKIVGSNCLIHSNVIVNQNIPSDSDVFVKQQLEITKKEKR